MSERCSICNHPARQEIDAMLLDESTTLRMVIDWMAREHPEEGVPYASSLSRHRKDHLKPELAGPARLRLKDGQLLDEQGRPVESVGIASALRAIVTVGIQNIMANPERVAPKDVLEALKIMRSLGNGSEDVEEIFQIWNSSIKRPRRRKPADDAVIVINPAKPDADDEEGNPFDDLLAAEGDDGEAVD